MPTINQLPVATTVTAADLMPLSQDGSTCAVSVGTLLAGSQPAIIVEPPCLLGRVSIGPGGPDVIQIGNGLVLNNATLNATAFDLSVLPASQTLSASDKIVALSGQNPTLLPVNAVRAIFAAGANISIDQNGTISSTSQISAPVYSITNLSQVNGLSQSDVVGVSRGGADHGITYGNFLDGLTIDLAQPAQPAADTDAFWTAQSTNTMLRQSVGALWPWIISKLPSWKRPVIELSANTTLDGTVHNNALLICGQPLSIAGLTANMGSGFSCDLINASTGNISLAANIISSTGSGFLTPLQCARIYCVTYSAGTVIFASIAGGVAASTVPGAAAGLAVTSLTTSSAALTWMAPGTGGAAFSYGIEYRVSGTTAWTVAATGITVTAFLVSGLLPNTSYDFAVIASNNVGAGPVSGTLTASTTSAIATPGQPTALGVTGTTLSSLSFSWIAPASGGPTMTYQVQYRATGQTAWITYVTNLAVANATINGLSAATSYDIQVTASNSTGLGVPSVVATASTTSASVGLVTSVIWNVGPSGTFTHGSGAIGVNAHVTPATAVVQFGFSQSLTMPPTTWTVGANVNSNLWGAYVSTPPVTGSWYGWVEGTDGSSATVYPTPFTVV